TTTTGSPPISRPVRPSSPRTMPSTVSIRRNTASTAGRTRRSAVAELRAGVLGHPIGHSKSPALHAAAYRVLGLDVDYRAHDVRPEQLAGFVAGLRTADPAAVDWLGLSVTMPLKAAMVGLMDSVSSRVERLGVLNTVVRAGDGALTGHNTDV